MDYPNRGTLWNNGYKKTDIQPDLKGDIKLELDLVRDMLENADTDHIVIKLSAWLGKDKDGKRKVSLQLDTLKKAPAAPSAKDPWDD